LVLEKGFQYLLNAFASLKCTYGDATLEIAGDGPARGLLDQQVRRLGLSHSVRFLRWQSDMSQIRARWHIFVQPSLHEGFGLAALEATCAALPVVASAVGGLKEIVVDGVTGLLVPAGDSLALGEGLTKLAASRELRRRLGAAGRARATTLFTPEATAEQIFDVYDGLVERRD
jgi:glycosyltransferase involved in cell wall biosynthesis